MKCWSAVSRLPDGPSCSARKLILPWKTSVILQHPYRGPDALGRLQLLSPSGMYNPRSSQTKTNQSKQHKNPVLPVPTSRQQHVMEAQLAPQLDSAPGPSRQRWWVSDGVHEATPPALSFQVGRGYRGRFDQKYNKYN